MYARYSEVQLLRIHEPKPGIFIAESPKVIERALDAGSLSVEALSVDDSGVSTASVKVNGRNLKEVLPLN